MPGRVWSVCAAGLPVAGHAQLPLRLGSTTKPPRGSSAPVGAGGGPAGGRMSSEVWTLGTPGGCTRLALTSGLMAGMYEPESLPLKWAEGWVGWG